MQSLVYIVTGANRGIGKGIVKDLLLRPLTTVVATVRDPDHSTSQSLNSLDVAEGSQLKIFGLNGQIEQLGYKSFQARLADLGVDRVDIVIANAGTSSGFKSVLETAPEDVQHDFNVNALGLLTLFQSCWPLLERSQHESGKKFVLITSSVGSIAALEMESFPSTSYGMSKVAANWLAKQISVEFKDKGLKVGIIHPGWVRTSLGEELAKTVGVTEIPTTVEESSEKVLQQIDDLALGGTSGKFIHFNGQELPW